MVVQAEQVLLQAGQCARLQALWNEYVQAMQRGGFSADTPMYVASGLLTYGANEGALMRRTLLLSLGLPYILCQTSCRREAAAAYSGLTCQLRQAVRGRGPQEACQHAGRQPCASWER